MPPLSARALRGRVGGEGGVARHAQVERARRVRGPVEAGASPVVGIVRALERRVCHGKRGVADIQGELCKVRRRQGAGQAERKTSWGSRRAHIHGRDVHGVAVHADTELGVVQCPKTRPKSIRNQSSPQIQESHRHRPGPDLHPAGEVGGEAGVVGGGGGGVDVGGGAGADRVDGRDAVVAGSAGGLTVLVGGAGVVGVDHEGDPARAAIGRNIDPVAADGGAAVVGRRGPGEVDRVGPAGRCREAGRGAGHGEGGDVGGGAGADRVDGRDAVVAGSAGGKVVPVGGVGVVGVGHEVGPARAAIGRNLDPVAADGGAAVVGRRGPDEVDRAGPAGRCREAGRGAGHGGGGGLPRHRHHVGLDGGCVLGSHLHLDDVVAGIQVHLETDQIRVGVRELDAVAVQVLDRGVRIAQSWLHIDLSVPVLHRRRVREQSRGEGLVQRDRVAVEVLQRQGAQGRVGGEGGAAPWRSP